MKSLFWLGISLSFIAWSASAAQAEPDKKDSFLGPIVTLINGQTTVGIGGKLHITDSIAVRPSYSFANLSGSGITVAGGSATYELDIKNSPLTPFAGVGVNFYNSNNGSTPETSIAPFVQIGVDVAANDGIALTADVKVPITSAPLGTVLSIGGGYRF
jgi:Outer membrane protein beta-barrel domain